MRNINRYPVTRNRFVSAVWYKYSGKISIVAKINYVIYAEIYRACTCIYLYNRWSSSSPNFEFKKKIKSTFSDKLSSGTFIDIKRGYYVVEYVTWLCNRWPILGSAAFFWYRLRYRHVQSNVVSDRNILFFLFVCFPLSEMEFSMKLAFESVSSYALY